jgi:glutamate/aspartate transport system permease protein
MVVLALLCGLGGGNFASSMANISFFFPSARQGYALGLNYWQCMGNVVLPQAFRNMAPLLLTQTIVLFQDVSLVYVLSMPDFLGAASKVAQRDGRLVEMYLFVAVVYFAMSYTLSSLVRRLEGRIAIIR